MGEEEKRTEEKEMEEKKSEEAKKTEEKEEKVEKPSEEKKEDKKAETATETPSPPQEIVLKVFMHCEGCARKVRRSLKGFEGVEDAATDCKKHIVVVKGEKADPLKVLERVQKKSHRQVELLSPIPKPPPPEDEKKAKEEEKPNPEPKKEEPQVITVVLKVHMHCEACSLEIKKRILRMKGVESAEPDLKSSQVKVVGVFEPSQLVDYVYKRTGKHAMIVKQEPEKKEEAAKDGKEEEKKGDEGGKEKKDDVGENKERKDGEETKGKEAGSGGEEPKVVEMKSNEFYYFPPQNYPQQYYAQPYYPLQNYPQRYGMEYGYPPPPPAPHMFSDENPNACSIV